MNDFTHDKDCGSAPQPEQDRPEAPGLTRRRLLGGSAAVAVLTGAGGLSLLAGQVHARVPGTSAGEPPSCAGLNLFRDERSASVFRMREEAALSHARHFTGRPRNNGDDARYSDRRGSFSKTLPHNERGEVDPSAYQRLLDALASGDPEDFERIPRGPQADRRLVNPQGAFKYELTGRDSHTTWIRPAPEFSSAETAAEMGEVYWKALLRDVPFSAFESDPDVADAVADLNAFSATVGPTVGGQVTAATAFRGETPGDRAGPYISQYLVQPIPMGNNLVEQRFPVPLADTDFMTTRTDWLAVQNGIEPPPLVKGARRYIRDGRSLGEYVHLDFSYQAYQAAALILLATPDLFDLTNPYTWSGTQEGFVSMGAPDVLDLVAKAANVALGAAWYQKWLVHRRQRPEVYAGRLHFQIEGEKDYGLPAEIENSLAVARVRSRFGTAFLPMAYPEGSPAHPAYPAGHASMAGACVTVLKAFFDEAAFLPDPVVANADGTELLPWTGEALTVGGELNKLANNIALGRDWAGVHYRSDGIEGLSVGEQQALGLLADYSRTYNEFFDGFTLTRFDGQLVQIVDGEILER